MKPRSTPESWNCRIAGPSDWPSAMRCWHEQLHGADLLDIQDFQLKQGVYPAQGLWIALQEERVDAVVWLWPESGGYAHVWPLRVNPALQDELKEQCGYQLWASAKSHYQQAGTSLFQTLIPVSNEGDLTLMQQLGFKQTALIERHLLNADTDCLVKGNVIIKLEPCDMTVSTRFNEIMTESFTGSLDVPELNAIQLSEGIHSHHFDSSFERYFIRHDSRGILGVVVLQGEDAVGLIRYLGLVPSARNVGYGLHAASQAITILRDQRCTAIELRVDARNTPAIRLYEKLGFQFVAKENMLIYR